MAKDLRPDRELRAQRDWPRGASARHARRVWRLSPLTWRLLTLNVLALLIPVAGLLFLGQYQAGLIQAEIAVLRTQGEIFAGALAEGAVGEALLRAGAEGERVEAQDTLMPELARPMLRRLVQPTAIRARLFAADGGLIADSRQLFGGPGGAVEVEPLPPVDRTGFVPTVILDAYAAVLRAVPFGARPPVYREQRVQRAADYAEVAAALAGEARSVVRAAPQGGLVISMAVPVQRLKQVHGALMLTTGSAGIERAVRGVRLNILRVFAVALAVTVLLTLYLAGTIVRPIRRLAEAAEQVRRDYDRAAAIPEFGRRGDEIGELSRALRDMTDALWLRLEAIERFAADVAHEIKNPLTSLRSAVETASRLQDPVQQRKLMTIIQEDVRRLDRLITDISDASRLDAELARAKGEKLDMGPLLAALVQIYSDTGDDRGVKVTLEPESPSGFVVEGLESRLVQVLRNLISNALSFSPPGAVVRLSIARDGDDIEIAVNDDGPGLPEGSHERIFERFYSERPEGEKFGTHSGLGLSICKQIVTAHGGTIRAENRIGADGAVAGARFVVRLAAAG